MTSRHTLRLSVLLLASCASVDTTSDPASFVEAVGVGAGVELELDPDARTARVEALTRAWTTTGLTLTEAVELGLLQRPDLDVALARIARTTAERAAVAQLPNPVLGIAALFPEGGGAALLEGGVGFDLLGFLQRDARLDVAEARLLEVQVAEAQRAVGLAAEIRAAFLATVAAEEGVALAAAHLDLTERSSALIAKRLELGAATVLDESRSALARATAELALHDARSARDVAQRKLAAAVGMGDVPAGMRLLGEVAAADSAALDDVAARPDLAVAHALGHRLDVRLRHAELERALRDLERERGARVRVLDGGIEVEREDDWALGPGMRIELPVFGRNEADVARFAALVAEREAELRAANLAVEHEVRAACAALARAVDGVRLAGAQVTRAEAALDHAQTAYERGASSLTPLLEAQRIVLAARTERLARQTQAARAALDLERALGGQGPQ